MANSDILLWEGDSYFQVEVSGGNWINPLKDITSDKNGVYEFPYKDPSFTGVDILPDNMMLSEISHDGLRIFIDTEGRIAIRLDDHIIKIID